MFPRVGMVDVGMNFTAYSVSFDIKSRLCGLMGTYRAAVTEQIAPGRHCGGRAQ